MLKLLTIVAVGAFEIIKSVKPQFPKRLKPCPDIDRRLLETCAELSANFPQFDFLNELSSNSKLLADTLLQLMSFKYLCFVDKSI